MDETQLGLRVDEVLLKLFEQVRQLKTENAQKSLQLNHLTIKISHLESTVHEVISQTEEQKKVHDTLRHKFDFIRQQQTTVIELSYQSKRSEFKLEAKLLFSQKINITLCKLIEARSREYAQQREELMHEIDQLKESTAVKVYSRKKIEKLLSMDLNANLQIAELLERYAADVRDAHEEKQFFEESLLKFESGSRETRKTFSHLCKKLIKQQKDFVELKLNRSTLSQEPCGSSLA